MAGSLRVTCAEHHAIYLGLPTSVGRSQNAIFRTLVSWEEKKLKDWRSNMLSQADKLTLIKFVAQAIPDYLMSCFKIPYGVI